VGYVCVEKEHKTAGSLRSWWWVWVLNCYLTRQHYL